MLSFRIVSELFLKRFLQDCLNKGGWDGDDFT